MVVKHRQNKHFRLVYQWCNVWFFSDTFRVGKIEQIVSHRISSFLAKL